MNTTERLFMIGFAICAAAGAVLSVLSFFGWCTLEGCTLLHGFKVYGIDVSLWGVAYFSLLLLLVFLIRFRWADLLRTLMVAAGLGVEAVLIYVQWAMDNYCAVCLVIAGIVLAVAVFELVYLLSGRTGGSRLHRRNLFRAAAFLVGIAAGVITAQPVISGLHLDRLAELKESRAVYDELSGIGKKNGWPMIRVYSDYFCPYCQKVEPTVNQVLRDNLDQSRIIFCDLPIHGKASKMYISYFMAAQLADNEQKEILRSREILFELAEQKVLNAELLDKKLSEAGIALEEDFDKISDTYEKCIALSYKDDVKATPTIVLESRFGDTKVLRGKQLKENFTQSIEELR
jgi:glutaredoxin